MGRTPHASTKACVSVVGTTDDLFFVAPWLSGDDRTEWLFGYDPAVVWRVIDDCRRHEEAVALLHRVGANGDFVAFGFGVLEETLDALVLHRVLHWSEQGARIRLADFDGFDKINHLGEELGVDRFVDVDALGRDAHLPTVLESAHDDFRGGFLDVDVGEDDGGVVAAELERDALECWCAGGHDLLAGGD